MKKIFLLFVFQTFIYSQWSLLNTGTTDPLFSCSFINSNTGWVGGGKIYFTSDGGSTWSIIFDPQNGDRFECMVFKNSLSGWAGSYQGKLYKTTNGGFNWNYQQIVANHRIKGMFFINTQTGWIVGQQGLSAKTTDGGNSWSNNTGFGNLYCVYYINAMTGIMGSDFALPKTTNGGITWNLTSIPANEMIGSFGFLDNNNGWAVCSKANYLNSSSALSVLRTSDFGNNWTEICAQSNDSGFFMTVNDCSFLTPDIGYYCGYISYAFTPPTTAGIFYKTTNGGANWTGVNLGSYVWSYEAVNFPNIQTGYVAGYNGVIYKTTNGGPIAIENNQNEIPKSFSLSQNYPNPFNPATKIKFSIPLSRGVPEGRGVLTKLIIYDLLGREVATLVNVSLKPGTYEVEWDASTFSSGVYFYKLVTESFSETKRMVLIK